MRQFLSQLWPDIAASIVETGVREDPSYKAGGKEEQGISTFSDTTSEVL